MADAFFLWRAARVIDRFSQDSLTATHEESNLAERLEKEIEKKGRSATSKKLLRYSLRTLCDLDYAEQSELLSANALAINSDYESGSEYMIQGGYSRLVECLASDLDIRLGTTVEKINYNADGVEVETDQEIYQGSHVIVTVPLGVLKTKTITFNPPLPEPKAKAIENMGFGNMEKIIFQFDEPFWRPTPQQKQNLYYVSDSLGEFPTFTDLSDTAGCPMMGILLVGDQSRLLMKDSESLIKQATVILGTMFPEGYRKPTAVHVTNWQKDPFALGSYSAVIPTTSAEDYTYLAEPIAGRLLFAGEATYRERAGYVEGAMASGLREARRILGKEAVLVLGKCV